MNNYRKKDLVDDVIHYLKASPLFFTPELMEIIKQSHDLNPYQSKNEMNEHLMWEEQCGINFPLLYLASFYLYHYAIEKNCDTFLFATRDCCHWFNVFKKLFPQTNAHYFHCSRNMFEKAKTERNPYFKSYATSLIKNNIEKTIFIDIHGTGKRAFSYFEKEFKSVPYCFLLSATLRSYSLFPSITKKYYAQKKFINLIFDARGSPIEMLNYDIQGTLQNYTELGPIRDPMEYSMNRLEAYHTCIGHIISQINSFDMIDDNIEFDFHECLVVLKKIYRVIQDNKPVISTYIMHPGKHQKIYDGIDQFLDTEKQMDKKNKYKTPN